MQSCWSDPTRSSEFSRNLRTGKLPPELLRGLVLGRLGARRPETLVGARLGVDAAAIAVEGDWALILTSDPITTASAGAGRFAVHVVCNDIAAMGAEPIGVLATLLFPASASPSEIAALTEEIDTTARKLNVEVLGGHTEVAPNVATPLVVMTGVGKAPRDRILTAGGARPGDALVLTKAAALEGTNILANDLRGRLASVQAQLLEEAERYGEEVSVVPEARLALEVGATAMHDPTEGGVIGALWEIAEASGCGFRVSVSAIPVREATRMICEALRVDPLRLIASGALLIACQDGSRMIDGLHAGGIAATLIGHMTASRERVLVHPDGRRELVTELDRDEIYRILEQA